MTPSAQTASVGFSFTVESGAPAKSKITIKLAGLKGGAIKVNKPLTVSGVVSPAHAAKVTVTLQRKVGAKWVKMKAAAVMSNAAGGAYSYKYKVAKKGTWRVQTAAAKTADFSAAATAWKTFKVK